MKFLALLTILMACSAMAFDLSKLFRFGSSPPPTVSELDLAKYAGDWYEIARLPFFFERHCYCATAKYTLSSNNALDIENSCNWKSPTGEKYTGESMAFPAEDVNGTLTTGGLEVSYSSAFSFSFSYLVLEVDENYQYALVGTSRKDHLWILSRTATIEEDVYYRLLDKAMVLGFDVSQVTKTYQGPECGQSSE